MCGTVFGSIYILECGHLTQFIDILIMTKLPGSGYRGCVLNSGKFIYTNVRGVQFLGGFVVVVVSNFIIFFSDISGKEVGINHIFFDI